MNRQQRRKQAEEMVAEAGKLHDPHLVMHPSAVKYFAGVDRKGVPIYCDKHLSPGKVYVMDGDRFQKFVGQGWYREAMDFVGNTKARPEGRADVGIHHDT